ncbi:conserved hypothetical protein, steroid delta-isomerase-related [Cupriavidus sp. YR651]|uniref:ester cyclase n=1 Tax=Cupriavidus sp. YR651 TaxID=1855315 RepID=UPI00088E70A2|nr:ester cyclase [Cupriavidus sp. YR651]SDB99450.1 conserved hypothetical protein, steroid delta-isomerase-related [Cupriavidus sp. YR651]
MTETPDTVASVADPADIAVLEARKRNVRRLYETCINEGRERLLDALLTVDFVGGDGERGAAAFWTSINKIRTAFPDVKFDVEDVIGEGDRVVVRWRFAGTHTGPFAGLPPTGKRVTQTGIAIYQCRGEKLCRAWLQVDRLGLLQQIGGLLIPA